MSISRRNELINWSIKSDSYIIEDDYSSHLRYDVKPIPALCSLSPERVIYTGSMSKMLFPSIRVSFMILPTNLLSKFNNIYPSIPCVVPSTTQKTLELFMASGDWEKHLRRTHMRLKKKHDILLASLKSEFGDKIKIIGSGAGLHVLIEPLFSDDTALLIKKAKNVGIDITPPSSLWYDTSGLSSKLILISFGGIDTNKIPQAISLLKQVWIS